MGEEDGLMTRGSFGPVMFEVRIQDIDNHYQPEKIVIKPSLTELSC